MRVCALMERDPAMHVDRLTSVMLDFAGAQSVGTCSTQLVPYQRVHLFGTRGRIEIPIPFNAPPDRATRIFVDDGSDLEGKRIETIEFDACDQYTIQGDLLSRAILDGRPAPYPLEDSVRNMRVIDALARSAEGEGWGRGLSVRGIGRHGRARLTAAAEAPAEGSGLRSPDCESRIP